jgi:hypothetical protein
MHHLVLRARPPSFGEHIVQPATPAVHADAHAGVVKHIGERSAGELTALSVLKISGAPKRARAFVSASTQNPASRVLDRRHASTRRECQSMIAIRYRKP